MSFWSRSLRATAAKESPGSTRISAVAGRAGGAAKKICTTRKPLSNRVEAATVSRVANNDFTLDRSQPKGRVGGLPIANLRLVFGEINLDPAFDLSEKSGEGIFPGLGGEIGFSGIIEGAGIVFKLL